MRATYLIRTLVCLCLATVSGNASAETEWYSGADPDKKTFPTEASACVQGVVEAYIAKQPPAEYRYTINGIDPIDGSETFCRYSIEKKTGSSWFPYLPGATTSVYLQKGPDACPRGTVDAFGACATNCPRCDANQTDPIHGQTSNSFQRATDFNGGGVVPLLLRRYYNSLVVRTGSLGNRWVHSYDIQIAITTFAVSGNTATGVRVYLADGRKLDFTSANGTTWIAANGGITQRLTRLTATGSQFTGWIFTDDDDTRLRFSAAGRLTSITLRSDLAQTLTYDSAGKLSKVTDPNGRTLTFGYDTSKRVNQVTDFAGKSILYGYNASGMLVSVTYPDTTPAVTTDDPVLQYHYEKVGFPQLLTGITDERGFRIATWEFDNTQKATASMRGATGTTLNRVSLTYNVSGTTTITDSLEQSRTYSYVLRNNTPYVESMTQRCPTCGESFATRTYDANGFPDITTDFVGNATDSVGTETNEDFSARGLLTRRVEGSNKPSVRRTTDITWHATFNVPTLQRVYDSSVSVPGTEKNRIVWTYNSRGQTTAECVIDPGNAVALAYSCGSVANAPTGVRQTRMTYCEAADVPAICPFVGPLLSLDGPRTDGTPDITSYAYYTGDEASCASTPANCLYRKGDVKHHQNALGQLTRFLRYDANGRLMNVTDANSVTTNFYYTPRGTLSQRAVRGSDNAVTTDDAFDLYVYDKANNITKITQPDGDYVIFSYDAVQRLIQASDNLGNKLVYARNDLGQLTRLDAKNAANATVYTQSTQFSSIGEVSATLRAAGAPTTTLYSYYPNGNLQATSKPAPETEVHDYDGLNRPTSLVGDDGGIEAQTQFAFDSRDNLTRITDPKGLDTSYGYNAFSDLVQLSSPDSGVTTYGVNAAGQRVSQSDGRGFGSTYSFDALNRPTGVQYPTDASSNVTYTYDVLGTTCTANESFPKGHLTKVSYGSGSDSSSYCYDRFGNRTRKVVVNGALTQTTIYEYTLGGRIFRITYPSLGQVRYVRDAVGRISEVHAKSTAGSTEVPIVTGIAYEPFGPFSGLTFGNGRTQDLTYDQDYSINTIIDGSPVGVSLDYDIDVLGNVSAVTERGPTGATNSRTIGYDGLERLDQFLSGTGNVESFTYDATGNRTSRTVGAATTVYAYEPTSHHLSSVGTTTRSYDGSGNTTLVGPASTGKEISYDARGLQSGYSINDVPQRTYKFDGNGQRVFRKDEVDGTNTRVYSYDERGRMLGEYNSAGSRLREIIWIDDRPVGVLQSFDGTTHQYIEADHLGTPRVAVQPTDNNIIWRWDVTGSAFGTHAQLNDPDGDGIGYNVFLRYPGQYWDSDTSYFQNGFRDYDPSTGRYLESDPIGLWAGSTTYGYVSGMPFDRSDRYGLLATPEPVTRPPPPPTRVPPVRPPPVTVPRVPPRVPPGGGGLLGRAGWLGFAAWFGWGAGQEFNDSPYSDDLGDLVWDLCHEKTEQEECDEEWARARKTCRELIYELMQQAAGRRKKRSVKGVTGGYTDVEECARGLVSERCGGNKYERQP